MWPYLVKWLMIICSKFEKGIAIEITPLIEAMSIIINRYKGEDLSKKLTHEFLS
jgi:hypothetical protein